MNKFRFLFLVLISFLAFHNLPARTHQELSERDAVILTIPESQSRSVEGIAQFINQNYTTDSEKLKALYTWITNNIHYDTGLAKQPVTYIHVEQLTRHCLETKSGVCMHYAQLFSDVANAINIPTYVVSGYTRQDGKKIDTLSHAWCCSYVDSNWVLSDPTWGAGALYQGSFVREVNYDWFMVRGDSLIKTHMPYDPMFQLLYYPLNNRDFSTGNIEARAITPYFNYVDTLSYYTGLPELERLLSANKRIRTNGFTNNMIREYYKYNNNAANVHLFNAAAYSFNEGIGLLNDFINYRNNQFRPAKEEQEIRNNLDSIAHYLENSKNDLRRINQPDQAMNKNITQLYKQIEDGMAILQEQIDFVNKYYKTGKQFRKTLFYRYTWYGMSRE